ncbi:MAG: nucleotidyltransferase domain-containing protein [bacterium]
MSTVRVISADKKKIKEFLKDYKEFLNKKNVSKAFLFGSWAKGNYSPHSDLDILIIIDSSPKKVRDRSPDFLPRRAPVGIDVFVFTTEEAERSPFVKNILKEAIPLIE